MGYNIKIKPESNTYTGTKGNDIFKGISYEDACGTKSALTTADNWVIDGLAGMNSVEFSVSGDLALTNFNNIQKITAKTTGPSSSTVTIDGLTDTALVQLGNEGSTHDLTFTTAQNLISKIYYKDVTDASFTVTVKNSALTGSSDTATIYIEDVVDSSSGATVLKVQPAAVGSGYESLTLDSTTTSGTENSLQSVLDGNGNSLATLFVTGDKKLTIRDALDSTVKNIDASAMKAGGIVLESVAPGLNSATGKATGGAGDDTFLTGLTAAPVSGNVYIGGAGTDTIGMGKAAAQAVTTANGLVAGASISGFETLKITDVVDGNVNLKHFGTEVKTLQLDNGLSAGSFLLNDNSTVELKGTALSGALTLNPSIVGENTAVSVSAKEAADQFNSQAIATSFESLTLNSGTTAQNLNTISTGNAVYFSGAGNFVTAAITANVIDASGLTGSATFTMVAPTSLSAGVGISITGSDNNDVLIGTANNDIISGGDGDDTITGGDGNDIVTGGDGIDTFVLGNILANNMAYIQDWTSGTDKLQLSKTVFTSITVSTGSTAGVDLLSVATEADLTGGTIAASTDAEILVHLQDTGVLYYNADAAAANGFAAIATLGEGSTLLATDWTIVA